METKATFLDFKAWFRGVKNKVVPETNLKAAVDAVPLVRLLE